jgi:hypothetical protein
MGAFVLIGIAAAIIGAVVGRWLVAIPLTLAWICYSVGLDLGWWGHGVGDGWVAAAALGAVAVSLGAIIGVVLRHGRGAGHFRALRSHPPE